MGVGIILIIIASYLVKLVLTNEILFYISSRFIPLTIFAATTSLLIGVILIWQTKFTTRITIPQKLSFNSWFAVIIFLVVAVLLPPTPLSSSTAQQRDSDLNTANLNSNIRPPSKFTNDSESYDFSSWLSLIANSSDLTQLSSKRIRVSGFISPATSLDTNYFLLARFKLTCCAIDAVPVGLYVKAGDWQKKFKVDQWVEITGETTILTIDDRPQLLINMQELRNIERPNNPYV